MQRLADRRVNITSMPADDVQALVHELQLRQIELEIQNEELRRVMTAAIGDPDRTEEELRASHDDLERRVEERTAKLTELVDELEQQAADRKRAEQARQTSQEKLKQAERLASIGTLATGIAHEINNPLGAIVLSVYVALRSLDEPSKTERLLQQIQSDAERCARIIRGMMDFARGQSTEKWPLDLNEVVLHAMDFTQEYARKRGVTLELRLADHLDRIVGHAKELGQAVVSLLHNGVQACCDGGKVTIETDQSEDRIRLEVRDDGCGMSADQMERAFDPFYTTRQDEGGTGLGLSIAHGIVSGHRGTIEVASRAGRGAVVTIEFPKYRKKEAKRGERPGG